MTSSKDVKSTPMSKAGFSGAIVAVIIMGILVVIAIVLAIISKKRSSFSSSLLEEQDNQGHRRSFNYFGSKRYSTELGMDKDKGFKGNASFNLWHQNFSSLIWNSCCWSHQVTTLVNMMFLHDDFGTVIS